MESYRVKQLVRSKSGLRIVATNEEYRSPFIMQEPEWALDKETSNCTKCRVKFGFTTRKHHCRRCGLIFCNRCSNLRMVLPRMCFIDPVRICTTCEPQTKSEQTFFDKHLKTLVNGAAFILEDCEKNIEQCETTHCKLSSDHRYLLFERTGMKPVDINQITSVRVSNDSFSGDKSMDINYTINGKPFNVCLGTNEKLEMKQESFLWMKAMEQAYNLLVNPV